MNTLTCKQFQRWMEAYGKASAQNDFQASANLFAHNAAYYETPFAEPIVGRQSIREYWNKAAQKLRDKKSTFEVVSVQAHRGIDRWQSQFTVIKSKNTWHWIACSWSSSTTRDCPNPSANGGIFKNVHIRNGHSFKSSENHDENSGIQRR